MIGFALLVVGLSYRRIFSRVGIAALAFPLLLGAAPALMISPIAVNWCLDQSTFDSKSLYQQEADKCVALIWLFFSFTILFIQWLFPESARDE